VSEIDLNTLPAEVRAVVEAAAYVAEYNHDVDRIRKALSALDAACRPSREKRVRDWLASALNNTWCNHKQHENVEEMRCPADRLLAGPLKPLKPAEIYRSGVPWEDVLSDYLIIKLPPEVAK
jgi:hypothetical protein